MEAKPKKAGSIFSINKMKKIFLLLCLITYSVQGQVGIGTDTPNTSAKLDVYATNKGFLPPRVALTATNVFEPVIGLSGPTELATAAGLLVYNTNSNGTITPGYYFWSGTAWVRLTVPTDNANNVSGIVAVANGGTGTTTGSITGSGALTFSAGGTNQNIYLYPSGTGNVGIANPTPTDKLVVGSSIAFHDGGDKVIGLGWSPGSGNTIFSGYPAEIRLEPGSGRLSFGTDPTSRSEGTAAGVLRRMTITAAGYVGIGTENPSVKLQVNGDIVANSIAGSSDARFKTNINPIVNPLEKVLKLNGITFDWNTEEFSSRAFSEKRSIGFIAQEVERILPEVVETEKTTEGYKSVQYDKIVALLVEAIKEQQKQIQLLQNEIEKIRK